MERFLLFIKHRLGFIWSIIELANNILFSLLYKKRLDRILPQVFNEFRKDPIVYRRLSIAESVKLYELLKSQPLSDLEYFKPHSFELDSIAKQIRKSSFLMMGAFSNDRMVGYFFLRMFVIRKCFVGRLIDQNYRGRGIGVIMNRIMYETSWRMGFRCLSTISRKNNAVNKAHSRNPNMIVIKDLKDNYILVEFVREVKNVVPISKFTEQN